MVKTNSEVTRLHDDKRDYDKCPVCKVGAASNGNCENVAFHIPALVNDIMAFFRKYVVFTDELMALPIAMWTIMTYMFREFDAFPYMVVTAATKRSGKTRLGVELMQFIAHRPEPFGAMSASSMFRIIEEEHPTLLIDEAEKLNGEAASELRSVLNVGYRTGSKVAKTIGNEVVKFDTYCPKTIVLIGDVYDTLRDRSIIIRLRRSDSPMRMMHAIASKEGQALRERIVAALVEVKDDIVNNYMKAERLEFLNDRDEEIWSPLFCACKVFAPNRVEDLKRIAVDIATEKTVDASSYTKSKEAESQAQQDEYSRWLLCDMAAVMGGANTSSVELVEKLKALTTSPWRKFRGGDGINPDMVAELVDVFGLKPGSVRVGKGKSGSNANVVKGYKASDVKAAIVKHNVVAPKV